jgi:hypothetical protein
MLILLNTDSKQKSTKRTQMWYKHCNGINYVTVYNEYTGSMFDFIQLERRDIVGKVLLKLAVLNEDVRLHLLE